MEEFSFLQELHTIFERIDGMLNLFRDTAYISIALAFINAFAWILFCLLATQTFGFSPILLVIIALALLLGLKILQHGLVLSAIVKQWQGRFDRLKELESDLRQKFQVD